MLPSMAATVPAQLSVTHTIDPWAATRFGQLPPTKMVELARLPPIAGAPVVEFSPTRAGEPPLSMANQTFDPETAVPVPELLVPVAVAVAVRSI